MSWMARRQWLLSRNDSPTLTAAPERARRPSAGNHMLRVIAAVRHTEGRIWPTPPTNPDHHLYKAWMQAYGHDLLAVSQPTA